MEANKINTVKILLIEDNPGDARLIREMLAEVHGSNCELEVASYLSAGLELMAKNKFDVVLLDLGLPDSQGLDTVIKVNSKFPNIPLIILTGLNDESVGLQSIGHGASDYVVKGQMHGRTLWRIIRYAIERQKSVHALAESEEKYRSLVELASDSVCVIQDRLIKFTNTRLADIWGGSTSEIIDTPFTNYIHPDELPAISLRYEQRLAGITVPSVYETVLKRKNGSKIYAELNIGIIQYLGKPAELVIIRDITARVRATEELKQSYEKLQKTLESAVATIASITEIRDPYTAGHQRRVSELACEIAEELGLPPEKMAEIRTGGTLHDVGKIYVPAEILSKPGKISEVEFSLIKNHPKVGYDIIKNIEFPESVSKMILQHHERLNGSGYPQGLHNGEIILEAKILAVADVVEAMSSYRPYRPALGIDVALKEIYQNKSILYDERVVAACIMLFQEKDFKFE